MTFLHRPSWHLRSLFGNIQPMPVGGRCDWEAFIPVENPFIMLSDS